MLETIRQTLANQFEAALCALHFPIDQCPDDQWLLPVANHLFCQTAFHALVYTDLFLGDSIDALKQQAFHRENTNIFRDYEEFEDRIPVLRYDRDFIQQYLAHCRSKAASVIAAETKDSIAQVSPFGHLPFARAEMHLHNIRHIQHHAAQLSLRLRQAGDPKIPWAKSGWRDP